MFYPGNNKFVREIILLYYILPVGIAPLGSVPQSSINRDVLYAVYWVDTDSDEWCRTIVISGPDNQSNVYVRYPDYGNVDMIPVSTLYKLPDQFYSLPLQVIQEHVHSVLNYIEWLVIIIHLYYVHVWTSMNRTIITYSVHVLVVLLTQA